MRKLFLVFACIFSFVIFSCVSGNAAITPEKTIDSRLVGGKFTLTRLLPDQYFSFTSTTCTIALKGDTSAVTVNAYTENGKVFSSIGKKELLSYHFIEPSEYKDELAKATASGSLITQTSVQEKIAKAETGLFVKFTVVGSASVDFFNWSAYQGKDF